MDLERPAAPHQFETALVRRSTRDGRELVRYLLAGIRDDATKPRDRLEAAKLLLERCSRRPQAVVDPLFADEAATAQRDRERLSLAGCGKTGIHAGSPLQI